MSLHKPRGASMSEYALLLFMLIGGAAAAIKSTGVSVRDTFASSTEVLGGAAQTQTTGFEIPDLKDGEKH